jgi:hypothetical protein
MCVDVLEFRIALFVDQSGLLAVSGFVDQLADPGQVLQDLLNNIWIFNRCDDPNWTTALFSLLYINAERRPVNTRLSRCAPKRTVGHRIGLRFRVLWFFDRMLRNNIFT